MSMWDAVARARDLDVQVSYDKDMDQYMEDRAKMIKEQIPNENMKETPIIKKVMGEKGEPAIVDKISWPLQKYNNHSGYITGVYTDDALANPVAVDTNLVIGSTVYVKMSADAAKSHTLYEHRRVDDLTTYKWLNLDVREITINGASSYLKCLLLENDRQAAEAANNTLSQFGAGTNLVSSMVGPRLPENSTLIDGYFERPFELYNYTQTLNMAFSASGQELTNDSYYTKSVIERMYRQCWHRMMYSMEDYMINGIRIGENDTGASDTVMNLTRLGDTFSGKRYGVGGLLWFMNEYVSDNIITVKDTTSIQGLTLTDKSWNERCWEFFEALLYQISLTSKPRKIGYCGAAAYRNIMNALSTYGTIQRAQYEVDQFGYKVTKLVGLNAELDLIQHAGFSLNPARTKDLLIVEDDTFMYRPKQRRDLTFIDSEEDLKKNTENGWTWRDGVKKGFVADFTIQFNDLDGCAYVRGIGDDFATS